MHSWSFRANSMQYRFGRLRSALMAIRSPRLGRTIHEPVVSSARSCQAPPRSSCCGGPMARADARERTVRKLCRRSAPYLFRIYWPQAIERTEDPYAFGCCSATSDLFLFNEGRHFELAKCLGAQSLTVDGVSGVRFAVWAPNAASVAVVGDFNSWDSADRLACDHGSR